MVSTKKKELNANLRAAERRLIPGVHRPHRQPQGELLVALSKKLLRYPETPYQTELKAAQAGTEVGEVQYGLRLGRRGGVNRRATERN
jgi:hypothetical protein